MGAFPDHVRKFLEKPNVAVLATIGPSGRPQATPVWFLVEDGHVLINTSQGRVKLRNMQTDPRVTLTIVDCDNPYDYVEILGRVATFDGSTARETSTASRSATAGSPTPIPPPTDRRTA